MLFAVLDHFRNLRAEKKTAGGKPTNDKQDVKDDGNEQAFQNPLTAEDLDPE